MKKVGKITLSLMEVLRNSLGFYILSLIIFGCNSNDLRPGVLFSHHLKYDKNILIDSCLVLEGAFIGTRMTYDIEHDIRRYTEYQNDTMHGRAIMYNKNYLYLKGQYFIGKQVGIWYSYWPNGAIQTLEFFDHTGLQNESFRFDSTGVCVSPAILEAAKTQDENELIINEKNLAGANLYLILNGDTIPFRKYESRIKLNGCDKDTIYGFYQVDKIKLPVQVHVI